MEKLEKDVLNILTADCRLGAGEIARMLGEEEGKVEKAVRSLEKSGVIVKYTAITDTEQTEQERVEALIEVKVTPQSGSGFDGIAERIASHEEVTNLYLMSGAYDFLVIVESDSVRGVARFISECISTFDCVLSTATHFILTKYKIEGAYTRRGGKPGRLSVQA